MDELAGVGVGERCEPERGVADQLGHRPTRPEGDERTKDGVLHSACEELGSAPNERLDDHRRADPLDCLANGRRVAEVERDSSGLGLVRSGDRRLDDCGEAQLSGRRHGFVRRLGKPLGDEGDAVGRQQPSSLLGAEPPLAGDDDLLGRGTVDPVQLRHRPLRPAQPVGALRRPPERARRRLGIRERRNGCRSERLRHAAGADQRREHRLVRFAQALERPGDRAGDLVDAGDDRWHEEHDQRIDAWIGKEHRNRVLVGRAGGRAEHVDRVGHGGLGGKRCLQSGLRLCREHREL